MFHVPEEYRVVNGNLATTAEDGNKGCFLIPNPYARSNEPLKVICSDDGGWEHVSVSLGKRCPKWDEMNHIKDLFWDVEDLAVQLHPPKSVYVNYHPYVLHLWRKSGTNDFCETPNMVLES